jgi:hypothetical protein
MLGNEMKRISLQSFSFSQVLRALGCGKLEVLFGLLPNPSVSNQTQQKGLLYSVLDFFFKIGIRGQEEYICKRVFFSGSKGIEANLLNWLFALFKAYDDPIAKEGIAVILSDFFSFPDYSLPNKMTIILPYLLNYFTNNTPVNQNKDQHPLSVPNPLRHNIPNPFDSLQFSAMVRLLPCKHRGTDWTEGKITALLHIARNSEDGRMQLIDVGAVTALLPYEDESTFVTHIRDGREKDADDLLWKLAST